MEEHTREEIEEAIREAQETILLKARLKKGERFEEIAPGIFKVKRGYRPQSAWETVKGVFGIPKG